MSRKLMALVAAAALAAPVTAHANTNADGAVRHTKATAATCAFEGLSTCPARRTKLFQFWGKVAETVDDTSSVELELRGVEHTGTLGSQLRKRLGDVVDLRLTGTTKFTKIDFTGGRSKISRAQLLQVVEDNPRATLYVDARMWPNSVWNDDEPILRAVRIVVDLSDLPVPAAGQGLSVAYFANKDLSGTPFATGTDNTVDFDWGGGGPVSLTGRTDQFSIKWTGSIVVPVAGQYGFRMTSDDGVRLYVDGVLVMDAWTEHAAANTDATVTLPAGLHTIDLRYFENGGVASAKFSWLTPGAASYVVVPAGALRTS